MARHFQLIYRQTIGKLKKYLETLYHILVIIGEKTGGTVRRIGKTEETDDKKFIFTVFLCILIFFNKRLRKYCIILNVK